MNMSQHILGVDVGGSGIKGSLVDIQTGALVGGRIRVETPAPATPTMIAEAFAGLIKKIGYKGPIGCGFPAIVQHGVAKTNWRNLVQNFGPARQKENGHGCAVH